MPFSLQLLLCQHAAQCLGLTLCLLHPLPCLTLKPPSLQSNPHPSHSSLVPNPRSAIIPPTVYLITNMTRGLTLESRKSPLTMVAMDPMSTPDQLPSKVAESKSLSLILGMPRVAAGTVFHRSSLSLATEQSPQPGAARECQQLAIGLTSLNSSSSIPPLVQPRATLTSMTSWLWRALGAQEKETLSWGQVKTTLTRTMLSLTQKVTLRQASLTPIHSH